MLLYSPYTSKKVDGWGAPDRKRPNGHSMQRDKHRVHRVNANTNSQQQQNSQKQQLKTSVVSHNRSTRKSVPTKEKVPMAKTKQGKIPNKKQKPGAQIEFLPFFKRSLILFPFVSLAFPYGHSIFVLLSCAAQRLLLCARYSTMLSVLPLYCLTAHTRLILFLFSPYGIRGSGRSLVRRREYSILLFHTLLGKKR